MVKKIKDLYIKNKEIILYVIFGVLTTLVNYAIYFPMVNWLHIDYIVSNVVAWFGAVLFAFFTNKSLVFSSKSFHFGLVVKEFLLFVASRLFSLGAETLILYLFIDLCKWNNTAVKIVAGIIVIILNYILSKLIVFRKTTKQPEEDKQETEKEISTNTNDKGEI